MTAVLEALVDVAAAPFDAVGPHLPDEVVDSTGVRWIRIGPRWYFRDHRAPGRRRALAWDDLRRRADGLEQPWDALPPGPWVVVGS